MNEEEKKLIKEMIEDIKRDPLLRKAILNYYKAMAKE